MERSDERDGRSAIERLAESLYRERQAQLLALARQHSACEGDAEEALHDAFVLFIDHFDPAATAPPLPWLVLTLKRRCWALRQQRERRARREARAERSTPKHSTLPEEMAEVSESVARVRELLAELRPTERRALTLLAFGYSYREICELTGWTYTKVNRSIAEGRARLRAEAVPRKGSEARRMTG